jgi:hypothetical protein
MLPDVIYDNEDAFYVGSNNDLNYYLTKLIVQKEVSHVWFIS